MTTKRPGLLYLITEDWYFWSHRLDLARAARDAGFEVTIATRERDHGERIRREGFHLAPLALRRRGRNVLGEVRAIAELVRLYRTLRPHLVHHVAMKPILYGSLAAWIARVPLVVNAFAGLGYTFTERRVRFFRFWMKSALKAMVWLSGSVVLVQNQDDRDGLIHDGIASAAHSRVIAGSGVDMKTFSVQHHPSGTPVIMLPARMLWNKGISEFVEAAWHLKNKSVGARFVLVGRCDEDNPAAISSRQLNQWVKEGTVEWWGHREDMPEVYAAATLVVLPSYREGLPKALLEAAACGRAIVATDVPGCRDVVRHGVNGLLVPPRDHAALAAAIEALLQDRGTRESMGAHGREMAEREWSTTRVVAQVLALYQDLLGTGSGQGQHA